MGKWAYFILFVGAGIFGLVALFSAVNSHSKQNAEETSSGPSLKFVVSNYKFDQPEYTVKANEKTKVSLKINEGIHAVEIKGLNIKLDKQNSSVEFTFDKPGTYEVECILPCGPGHGDMKAKVIVQ